MSPEHCGLPMLHALRSRSTEDRYDLAVTVETIQTLYQCEHCGAKLTTILEQPYRPEPQNGH